MVTFFENRYYLVNIIFKMRQKLIGFGLLIGLLGFQLPKTDWTSQPFKLLYTLKGHTSPVTYVQFRQEDNLLASGDKMGTIFLSRSIGIEKQQIIRQLKGHSGQITHIAFYKDGNRLASASYDGSIRVWAVSTGRLLKTFHHPSFKSKEDVEDNEPTFLVFSPSGRSIYFGGYSGDLMRVNLKSGKTTLIYTDENGGITSGVLSPNQKYLVFAAAENIHFLDLKMQKVVKSLSKSDEFEDYICELAFSPNNDYLLGWAYNGKVHFWNWQNDKLEFQLPATTREGSSDIAFATNGTYFLTGNDASKVKIWGFPKLKQLQTLEGHEQPVTTFTSSKDDNYIATGSRDHTVRIWAKPKPKPTSESIIPKVIAKRAVEVQHQVTVKNTEVTIDFWDNLIEDGDSVSVNLNGKWILENYKLKKVAKRMRVKLQPTGNYLSMLAHNEGTRPPNTTAIRINDGERKQLVILKSNLETNATVDIKVSP